MLSTHDAFMRPILHEPLEEADQRGWVSVGNHRPLCIPVIVHTRNTSKGQKNNVAAKRKFPHDNMKINFHFHLKEQLNWLTGIQNLACQIKGQFACKKI